MLNFREHEWSKHGTCATSLGATGDQHKYFAKALEMKTKYDAGKYVTYGNMSHIAVPHVVLIQF